MVDAYPNVQLIEAIAYGKDAYDVYGILADGGFSLTVDTAADLLSWAMDGEAKDNFDKACMVDFVIRHHGKNLMNLGWHMFRRYLGMAHTNKCSNCHRCGHNRNHCPW